MDIRGASIQEWRQKIKDLVATALGNWGLVAIVLLLGVASFGLGRFSALEDVRPVVDIGQAPIETRPAGRYMGGLYVASRTGSVYYYPWCSGAASIAPGKQLWFTSAAAAQKAGYTPSKSCKGL
ncbi:hypothetical protein HY418_01120 [Candidatus Kaiserbacteria bacterium]|nr:hypothetical protein [Candidatus Kaiserbacteria bacterium]